MKFITLLLLILILIFGYNQKKSSEKRVTENVVSKNDNQENQLKCWIFTFFNSKQNSTNLWQNFKIGNKEFQGINSESHTYFAENCTSITVSPDKRVFLFREVLNDKIQNNYDYYEAPYVVLDKNTQDYASHIGVIDKKIIDLSLSNAKADYVNSHDFIFEGISIIFQVIFLK